jgi:hypothetical protein
MRVFSRRILSIIAGTFLIGLAGGIAIGIFDNSASDKPAVLLLKLRP